MTGTTPKFSIIVPVYNEERYLSFCVDSLRKQTLRDIEIIIVDDGSTDRSGLIADWYARQDQRIHVVHQENSGQGPARNRGIREACGKYIGFTDADDWVQPEMFQRLYGRASQIEADIVLGGVKLLSHGSVTKIYEQPKADAVLRGQEDIYPFRRHLYGPLSGSDDSGCVPGYVWVGCFRRSFINENHILFQNMMSEDTAFLIEALQAASCVAFVAGADYCYRRDGQISTTNTFNTSSLEFYTAYMCSSHRLLEREATEHQHECLIRWSRNVIDLSRRLVHRIETSSLSSKGKSVFIHQVNINPFLIEASSRYSWHDLPRKFVPFYWCQMHDRVQAERYMMGAWARASILWEFMKDVAHRRSGISQKGEEAGNKNTECFPTTMNPSDRAEAK